jgi:hypothetical protein
LHGEAQLTAAGAASFSVHAAVAKPVATRTMMACVPPLVKNCRTAYETGLSRSRPPYWRSKSAKLEIVIARLGSPLRVYPTNAAIEVATPVIVCTPLGFSTM